MNTTVAPPPILSPRLIYNSRLNSYTIYVVASANSVILGLSQPFYEALLPFPLMAEGKSALPSPGKSSSAISYKHIAGSST